MGRDFAIGTDIVDIDRVANLIECYGTAFLNKIYCDEEIKWCSQKSASPIHFAGRFAAKEAVKKALLTLGVDSRALPFKSIFISRQNDKPPRVQVPSEISSKYQLEVSISHTDKLATATAFAQVK
jgi:holo-[acyl-carrier protein] synthase|tara:strand:+ start:3135 stop:3509 length:375 start_codon:yes stop_codon:yes gene_type:complete